VGEVLRRISLSKYLKAFRAHEIDVDAFVELAEEDLVKFFIYPLFGGQAFTLLKYILSKLLLNVLNFCWRSIR
jgi:hypothetical protein